MSEISEIIKTVTSLTAKKAAVLGVLMLFLIGAVVSFEIHTSQFQLDKLSRISAVLKGLAPLVSSDSKEVSTVAKKLVSELNLVLEQESVADPTPTDPRVLLVLLLSSPWLILALVGVGEALEGESDWYYGVAGCLFIGLMLGLLGYSVPTEIHWFYRYVCIPIFLTGVLLFIFYAIGDDKDENT